MDRSKSGPYDPLQRPEILNGIPIKGERIRKLDLRSGMRERKMTNAKKTFCQLAANLERCQI